MTQSSDTGHAKNMANLESLIFSIIKFGDKYNPSKESIKLDALQNLLAEAKASFVSLKDARSAYTVAVDVREMAFLPFNKLITRIFNALKASASASHMDESVETIIRKLQGRRASAKLTEEEKRALEAEGKVVNQNSVSQMSYNFRLENFEELISLLSNIPEYAPNEEELKLESLKTLYKDLKLKNDDVLNAYIELENERSKRNVILYQPINGVVDRASDIKSYIKSVYGTGSTEYKEVSGLFFKTRLLN